VRDDLDVRLETDYSPCRFGVSPNESQVRRMRHRYRGATPPGPL